MAEEARACRECGCPESEHDYKTGKCNACFCEQFDPAPDQGERDDDPRSLLRQFLSQWGLWDHDRDNYDRPKLHRAMTLLREDADRPAPSQGERDGLAERLDLLSMPQAATYEIEGQAFVPEARLIEAIRIARVALRTSTEGPTRVDPDEFGRWTIRAEETENGYRNVVLGDPLPEGESVEVIEVAALQARDESSTEGGARPGDSPLNDTRTNSDRPWREDVARAFVTNRPAQPEGAGEARVDKPRVALRPYHDDAERLDDVVVEDVAMFRAEMMDDGHLWMACYFDKAGTAPDLHFSVIAGKTGRAQLHLSATDVPPHIDIDADEPAPSDTPTEEEGA